MLLTAAGELAMTVDSFSAFRADSFSELIPALLAVAIIAE